MAPDWYGTYLYKREYTLTHSNRAIATTYGYAVTTGTLYNDPTVYNFLIATENFT